MTPGLVEIGLGLIALLGGAVVALFKMWRGAEAKAKAADRAAKTQKEIRGHEKEASQLDDTSLADRITRKR
jgi:hypothetical protein